MPDGKGHDLSPGGVPLMKPRPLWHRMADGALLAKIGGSTRRVVAGEVRWVGR